MTLAAPSLASAQSQDGRCQAAVPELNMAIAKKLHITARWQLEMRGEAFPRNAILDI